MKTIQTTITRNFRVHNEDVYLKETRERIVELEEGENPSDVEQIVLQDMIASFKKSYPSVKTYLNFDEVIQVNIRSNSELPVTGTVPPLKLASQEKINKGTIEEQIDNKDLAAENMVTEIGNIRFEPILKKVYEPMLKNFTSYPKVKDAFDKKLQQFQSANTTF